MSAAADPVVAQYFDFQDEDGRPWSVKFRDDVPYGQLTRLHVWPLWLADGLLTFGTPSKAAPTNEQRVADLTAACRAANPAAEVYVSSGYDDAGAMYLQAAEQPQRFADSVVAVLREYGLDGYDMDWENGIQAEALNTLATALRQAFDAAGKQDGKHYGLTMAVWPDAGGRYDLATLGAVLDAINIMSYGDGVSLADCVDSYAGFPTAKIVGGVDTEDGYPGGVDTLGPSGSIATKSTWAMQNGLAGMMAWRLDNDYVADEISTYKGAEQLWQTMTGRVPDPA